MIRSIAATLAFTCIVANAPASAQDRLVRLIVAFPPGGPVDLAARTISEQLGKELNARVIVDNRPGGNGAIAAQNVAQSAPDGSTLWLSSVGAVAINPVLYDKLSYDMREFAPVSLVVDNDELLVVKADNPAKDAAEFVANAKKSPQPVAIASSGSAAFRISPWSSSQPPRARICFTFPTKGLRLPSTT